MSGFSFNDLNLSAVKVSMGGSMLAAGKYIARIKEAKIVDTNARDGSKRLEVTFEDIAGSGSIKHWLNLYLVGKAEATNIGRGELKKILICGGHPNPDQPGDIATMAGLEVGIRVVESSYEKDGNTRKSAEVKAVFDPAEIDPARTPREIPKERSLEDTIPF